MTAHRPRLTDYGMENVVLIIHLIVSAALVGIILLQRSEGGGIGVGGGGNMGAVAPRAQADILTKTTGWLAAIFIATSLALVVLANHRNSESLVDQLAAQPAPVEAPAAPAEPSVPLAQ